MTILTISKEQSNKFANMSFACALFVVLIHVFEPLKIGSPAWWFFSCTEFRIIAVPYFFLASGFFLAGRMYETGWWGHALKKRVHSLLIPYVTWSVLWECYLIGILVIWNVFCGREIFANFNPSALHRFCGLDIFYKPHLYPLWYVRTLLMFLILSPLFNLLLKKNRSLTLSIAFVLSFHLFGDVFGTWRYVVDEFLGMKVVFFFLVGLALRQGLISFPHWGKILPIVLICSCWICERLFILNHLPFDNVLRAVNTVAMLYLVWSIMPDKKWPTWLTSMAFPIFLVHAFWDSAFATIFYDHPETIPQIVFRFSGMLIPTFITVLVLRRLPKCVNDILFGGR